MADPQGSWRRRCGRPPARRTGSRARASRGAAPRAAARRRSDSTRPRRPRGAGCRRPPARMHSFTYPAARAGFERLRASSGAPAKASSTWSKTRDAVHRSLHCQRVEQEATTSSAPERRQREAPSQPVTALRSGDTVPRDGVVSQGHLLHVGRHHLHEADAAQGLHERHEARQEPAAVLCAHHPDM